MEGGIGSSNGSVRLIQCLVMGAKMPAAKPANNQMPGWKGSSSGGDAAGEEDDDDDVDDV